MPVMIDTACLDSWMDVSSADLAGAKSLLSPAPEDWLVAERVSPQIRGRIVWAAATGWKSGSTAQPETATTNRHLAPDDFVILEATGGLETPPASALATVGIAVTMVNPRQVRDFARATARLAKTDRLDAEVLARFGEAFDQRHGR
jgi:hypothetical protein